MVSSESEAGVDAAGAGVDAAGAGVFFSVVSTLLLELHPIIKIIIVNVKNIFICVFHLIIKALLYCFYQNTVNKII
ncbi:MAG: hypothetical protein CL723_00545 [Chloroflexi bacterium]|nr:hypothetical protein [Chloroflexota bacterium]